LDTDGIQLNAESDLDQIVRLRIKMLDPETEDYVYHVNLLVFNMRAKTIEHFEPLYAEALSDDISLALKTHFASALPDFTFTTLDYHPQKQLDDECRNMGLCVAYVVRFAVCHIYCNNKSERTKVRSEDDIYRFATAIHALY
jgi:hypothetical protein